MPHSVKTPSIADAVLHPQRLEILRMLALHGTQTVRDLARNLPSISQATLYRHVKTLLAARAIITQGTRKPERGAPEALYAPVDETVGSLRLRGAQRSAASMRRYFVAMQASVLASFERALARGPIPSRRFAVRNSVIYLNETELREVYAIFARLKDLEAKRGGRRAAFSLSLALFPERDRN